MKETKAQFEKGYAKRSGTTVDRLHKLGQRAYPCECGRPECRGFVMLSKETAANCEKLGQLVNGVFEPANTEKD